MIVWARRTLSNERIGRSVASPYISFKYTSEYPVTGCYAQFYAALYLPNTAFASTTIVQNQRMIIKKWKRN